MHASDQTTKNETGGRENRSHTNYNGREGKAQSISLSLSLPSTQNLPPKCFATAAEMAIIISPPFFWVGPDRKLISAQSEKKRRKRRKKELLMMARGGG